MNSFYSTNISKNLIVLDDVDSKHAIKVLRLKEGDKLTVVDGLGTKYYTKIIDANYKKTNLEIESKKVFSKEKSIIIALSPTKNKDRVEWFIEKATEIGMTDFYPIICHNSERRKLNVSRLEKKTISALKQSGRYWKSTINEQVNFKDFIKSVNIENKYIAHCNDTYKEQLNSIVNKNKPQLILIGPEGDFTLEEIKLAEDLGFINVSLGDNRLRTETAGIVATTLMAL